MCTLFLFIHVLINILGADANDAHHSGHDPTRGWTLWSGCAGRCCPLAVGYFTTEADDLSNGKLVDNISQTISATVPNGRDVRTPNTRARISLTHTQTHKTRSDRTTPNSVHICRVRYHTHTAPNGDPPPVKQSLLVDTHTHVLCPIIFAFCNRKQTATQTHKCTNTHTHRHKHTLAPPSIRRHQPQSCPRYPKPSRSSASLAPVSVAASDHREHKNRPISLLIIIGLHRHHQRWRYETQFSFLSPKKKFVACLFFVLSHISGPPRPT